jgi:hypothetical protein
MKLTGWMKTTFAGTRSSCAATQVEPGAHSNVAEIVRSQPHSGFATLGWGF